MKIEIFSDFVCPYCYIGKVKLDQAIAETGYDNIKIEFKSFLLYPDSPSDISMPYLEFLEKTYGKSSGEFQIAAQKITEAAKSVGLNFRYDIMQSCNTQKAHRLCKWAKNYEKEKELIIELMDGYFTEGMKLNENNELLTKVEKLGLDISEARKILESEEYLDEVRMDIYEAHQLGVETIPFFLFEDKYAIIGAQPVEAFVSTLRKTSGNTTENFAKSDEYKDAPSCGENGCEIPNI